MDINFELYRIFYYAASAGSFSEAARNLYISQSAVSQAIKQLEDKIGSKLFNRSSRAASLTNEGELLFKHVEQAYNFIKTGENKIFQMQNMSLGEIRIGVSDTICKYFVIAHLEKFTKLYPKIKIRVINRTSDQILEVVKNGLADLGIVTLPVIDKSFDIYPFMTVRDIFVASGKFSRLLGKPIPLKELANYPVLMLQANTATRRNLDSYLKAYNIEIVPEIELENIDLLVEFARIGLGISHVLEESAAGAIRRGELFEVKTRDTLPERRLGIITTKNVPLSNTTERFIDMLSLPQQRN